MLCVLIVWYLTFEGEMFLKWEMPLSISEGRQASVEIVFWSQCLIIWKKKKSNHGAAVISGQEYCT